jgi:hypothetical protein
MRFGACLTGSTHNIAKDCRYHNLIYFQVEGKVSLRAERSNPIFEERLLRRLQLLAMTYFNRLTRFSEEMCIETQHATSLQHVPFSGE